MNEKALYTAEEAAAEVGVTPQTIYTWTARKYLKPASKRGRFNLYLLADVFACEATRKHKHRKRSSA